MYSYLTGKIVEKLMDASVPAVVLDNNGIGYHVFVANRDAQLLNATKLAEVKSDNVCKLYLYTHRQETDVSLYGFVNKADKNFFIELLKVQGVGPKLALKILDAFPAQQVASFIYTNDTVALSSVSGLGKKTASKIVLELHSIVKPYLALAGKKIANLSNNIEFTPELLEVKDALFKLSYTANEIDRVLPKLMENANEKNTTEVLLKKALKLLSSAT